jgi:aryl-alcohol dehydrogenase-like predicted oxidoreductase
MMTFKDAARILPWFDCARSYGLSEKFVGEFLRSNRVKPDDVFVSSKWGYTYVAEWKVDLKDGLPHEVKDHSVENFLRQIEETKSFIGQYVDLYQVHSATFESGILTDSRVHEALAACKNDNGWMIGLSVSGPNQNDILREAMKINCSDGTRLFDSVQCTYNVLEQRPGEALLEAYNKGMDIIIKEGMANGRILKNEKFQNIAKNSGYPADQLALACILAQPFHPRVLSGAITPEQLSSNIKALELSRILQEEKRDLLTDVLAECVMDSEQYWKDRSALAWN